MDFRSPVIEGKFLKRYKRFFADVEINGQVVTAHVPNTGSLKSCNQPGSPCWISESADPKRALKYTLEAIKIDSYWVGVNTSWPNKLAVEFFLQGKLPHWQKYDSYQAEVKISPQSRIDLVLWNARKMGSGHKNETAKTLIKWTMEDFETTQPVHFVEIKNVTFKEGIAAQFPDAVTERGQKHIQELAQLIKKGFSAEMLFIIQRTDVECFSPAGQIDPVYARLLESAANEGLEVTAVCVEVDRGGIHFVKPLEVRL